MKTVLQYGVANGKNPKTEQPIKRPYLTNRRVYDSQGVVEKALEWGYIRGKLHDLVGVLNGCIATVKELIKMGFVVDLDSWLLFYLALTGLVGDDMQLSNKTNGLRFRVRALKDLKVNLDDFLYERVGDDGKAIRVDSVTSPNAAKDTMIKTKPFVANGKNLSYNTAWGDSIKASWLDEDGAAQELALTPSEVSETNLRFEWNSGLAGIPDNAEVTLTFCLHGSEGGAEKSASHTAKVVPAAS